MKNPRAPQLAHTHTHFPSFTGVSGGVGTVAAAAAAAAADADDAAALASVSMDRPGFSDDDEMLETVDELDHRRMLLTDAEVVDKEMEEEAAW